MSNTTGSAGASSGSDAASGLKEVLKQGFGVTENLRQGANKFFDDSIQPSAAKDTEAGVTTRHKDQTPFSTSTVSGAGSGSTVSSETSGGKIL